MIVVAIKTFISQARVFNFVFHKPAVLISSPVVLAVKNLLANAGDVKRCSFSPWVGKISWRKAWRPTPVFLPGESQGQRSPVGYHPWGRTEFFHRVSFKKKTKLKLPYDPEIPLLGIYLEKTII